MDRMSSSLQSWVEEHKLATVGAACATAVGASVAYSRRRARMLALAVVGGAALAHHYRSTTRRKGDDLDYDFYSQLPPATDADGNEKERWSW